MVQEPEVVVSRKTLEALVRAIWVIIGLGSGRGSLAKFSDEELAKTVVTLFNRLSYEEKDSLLPSLNVEQIVVLIELLPLPPAEEIELVSQEAREYIAQATTQFD